MRDSPAHNHARNIPSICIIIQSLPLNFFFIVEVCSCRLSRFLRKNKHRRIDRIVETRFVALVEKICVNARDVIKNGGTYTRVFQRGSNLIAMRRKPWRYRVDNRKTLIELLLKKKEKERERVCVCVLSSAERLHVA